MVDGRGPEDLSLEDVLRPDVEDFVAGQYLGRRAGLRPVFDAVREAALGVGADVRMEGHPAYVPFLRAREGAAGGHREFAAVAPTAARVELGLRLPAPPPTRRLEPATAPGRCTHKVVLARPADVDAEVRALLRAAYDQNG